MLDFGSIDRVSSPYTPFLQHLTSHLATTPPAMIHRVIIPTLLSPAIFPSTGSRPDHLLQFLHGLRAILRAYPTRVTALISLPLSLHPRSTGLVRWIETLSDGVLELAPFPSNPVAVQSTTSSGAATAQEEPPQGMLTIHRLPVFHEKGGGGGELSGLGGDLAFTLSRRKGLVIKPFSLPPVEGDTEAQEGLEGEHGKATKIDIEF